MTDFPPLQVFDVTMSVDEGDTFTFLRDGQPIDCFEINPGQAMIRIQIEDGKTQPRFLTHPIEWFAGETAVDEPIDEPASIMVQRNSDDLCTLVDFNEGVADEQFFFRVSVDLDGRVVTSRDPTIVNRKIGGADDDDVFDRVFEAVKRVRALVSKAA